MEPYVEAGACNNVEVDRIWGIIGICHGSFENNILSTSGWM